MYKIGENDNISEVISINDILLKLDNNKLLYKFVNNENLLIGPCLSKESLNMLFNDNVNFDIHSRHIFHLLFNKGSLPSLERLSYSSKEYFFPSSPTT